MYWVIVEQISHETPGRNPDLPRVTVRVRKSELPHDLKSLRSASTRQNVDLVLLSYCAGPFKGLLTAQKQRRIIATTMRNEGFTVNGALTVWGVYVIQLDQAFAPDVTRPWVYVGETTKSFEQRFLQHKLGQRNRSGRGRLFAKVVLQHGVKLRPDLYPPVPNVHYSRRESETAEHKWIEELRSRGFQVEGGHEEQGQTRRRFS